MSFLNKVQLIGRVGQDPSVSATTDGGTVVNFSLATNEKANGKTYTKWHKIVAWNGAAKAAQYLAKGRLVYVEGRLDYNEYKGVVYARIVTQHIQFLDSNKGQVQENGNPYEQGDAPQGQMAAGMTQATLF
jgi:single-strand DNA-binding protein